MPTSPLAGWRSGIRQSSERRPYAGTESPGATFAEQADKSRRVRNAGQLRCDRGDYARVLSIIAHEAAGASGTRRSARPLRGEGGTFTANPGRIAPRERESARRDYVLIAKAV